MKKRAWTKEMLVATGTACVRRGWRHNRLVFTLELCVKGAGVYNDMLTRQTWAGLKAEAWELFRFDLSELDGDPAVC